MINETLEEINNRVLAAFRKGQLSSYDRQQPKGEVLKELALAAKDLAEWEITNEASVESLRLGAMIQEALMKPSQAIVFLEQAIEMQAKPSKSDFKRLAMCRAALEEAQMSSE